VIAKNHEGKEIYSKSKIYMPHPARFGVADRMARGPYEKSGMIRDTSLPPMRTVRERFEIVFPYKDVKSGKEKQRRLTTEVLDVEVRLLYLPYGERNQDHFIWKISKNRVRIGAGL